MMFSQFVAPAFCFVTGLAMSASSAPAFAADLAARVEVPADAVLAPPVGFDDNDQVGVVLHGFLPNACYTLADHAVEKDADGHRMRIRQFAIQRQDGICALDGGTPGKEMPEHLLMAVPFTSDIAIGRLPVGDYQFDIQSRENTPVRALSVAKAPTTSVDSMPYAMVSGVAASDLFMDGKEIEVTLTGLLNSSCTELTDQVQVKKMGDVFVVLPTLKIKSGPCIQAQIPFERKVKLGQQATGRYLIHVRSMNGRAVNKVVEVIK